MNILSSAYGVFAVFLGVSLTACGGDNKPSKPERTTEERLAAPADIANGAFLFRSCGSCHMAADGAKHRVGPNLYGVIDAPIARHTDFKYSRNLDQLGADGGVWDNSTLDQYLENPRNIAPKGRMSYAGEKDAANRRDIIAYLKSLDEK